jgi:very-short-patch-repair endonuclease
MRYRTDIDVAVALAASRQAGAFSRDQATEAGADDGLVERRTQSGQWIAVGSDVFTLPSHPPELDQRRWIGVLAAGEGARLTHESAAELHAIDGIVRGRVVVTTAHGRRLVIPGGTQHQLDDVLPHHRVVVRGFPTTTPARTFVDLAAVTSFTRLRTAAQDIVVRRLASFGEIGAVLREVRRRGKPGIRRSVEVLSSLDGDAPPASVLERLLLDVARRAGVPVVAQHPLPTHLPVPGLVDFAAVDSKLILEADGRLWHARLQAMTNDRQRDREAARLGWQTLRFVHQDLKSDPDGEARGLREVHELRMRAYT